MNLDKVHRGVKKFKRRRRVGRGPGSGWGKTSGRGHKGQGQLAGWTSHPAFEGGQMPLSRRVPKRGFNNQWARLIASVNVGQIDAAFKAGEEVTPESLVERDLIHGKFELVKILGDGEVTKKFKISAHRFSGTAEELLKAAGCEITVLPGPAPVVKNQKRTKKKESKAKPAKTKKS
ncbi:MAG: 50S ribosomal protein L15 [Pirellulales bacterium]